VTTYGLAQSVVEFWLARELLQSPVVYPTVLAWRNGRLIGAMGTQPFDQTNQIVVGGPLVIALPRPIRVAMRLVEHYETAMAQAGVVAYHFHVDADNAAMKQVCDHMHAEPYESGPHGWWYRRLIPVSEVA
jgi:hypothetical protein